MGLTILSLWLGWIALANFNIIFGGGLPPSLYGFYNLEFFFGMMIAYWARNRTILLPSLILMVGLLLFAAAAVAENTKLIDGYADVSRLVYGSTAALIVLGAATAGLKGLVAVPRWLPWAQRPTQSTSFSLCLLACYGKPGLQVA